MGEGGQKTPPQNRTLMSSWPKMNPYPQLNTLLPICPLPKADRAKSLRGVMFGIFTYLSYFYPHCGQRFRAKSLRGWVMIGIFSYLSYFHPFCGQGFGLWGTGTIPQSPLCLEFNRKFLSYSHLAIKVHIINQLKTERAWLILRTSPHIWCQMHPTPKLTN